MACIISFLNISTSIPDYQFLESASRCTESTARDKLKTFTRKGENSMKLPKVMFFYFCMNILLPGSTFALIFSAFWNFVKPARYGDANFSTFHRTLIVTVPIPQWSISKHLIYIGKWSYFSSMLDKKSCLKCKKVVVTSRFC